MKLKVIKVGNHWYPSINHQLGYIEGFEKKIDLYLNRLNVFNTNELTIDFEEIGVIYEGINIIYFNEVDIVRYLTTDDEFNIKFVVNNHEFSISSYLYWCLENQFNFNFHKNSYKVHIY